MVTNYLLIINQVICRMDEQTVQNLIDYFADQMDELFRKRQVSNAIRIVKIYQVVVTREKATICIITAVSSEDVIISYCRITEPKIT